MSIELQEMMGYEGDSGIDEESLKKLDSANTDEEINALLNEVENSVDADRAVTPDKEEKEPTEEKPEGEEEVPEGDDTPDENPDEEPDPETPEEDEPKEPVLTDEILSKYPEEERKALEKYKGKSFSEITKALANSQSLIGKKETENEQLKTEQREDYPEQPTDDKVEQVISSQVEARIRAKYPNYPTDPEEQKEFRRELFGDDPMTYRQFEREVDKVEADIRRQINTVLYINNNHSKINADRTTQAISTIERQLKNMGVDDPKVLGFDLEVKTNEDGSTSNALIDSLRLDKSGKPDPRFHKFVGNVALLDPETVVSKLFMEKGAEIANHLTIAARKAGYEAARKKKTIKSLGSGDGKGQPRKPISLEDAIKSNDPQVIKAAAEQFERESNY